MQVSDGSHEEDGLAKASRAELAALTQQAMNRVSERYRLVLALRFYEDLPHADIARVIGCSEFNARTLFFRAKHALTRELKRLGVKRTALLAALGAFGQMTLHPSSASAATVSVSASAAIEGVIAGLLTAKIKIAVAAMLLLSTVGVWSVLNGNGPSKSAQARVQRPPAVTAPVKPQATAPIQTGAPLYVHYVSRGMLGAPASGAELCEMWIYFPQGANGPHIERSLPVRKVDNPDWVGEVWHVQTADLNYRHYPPENVVHIENARWLCRAYHTVTLPTDSVALSTLILESDGSGAHALVDRNEYTFERDPQTGFVISGTDTHATNLPPYRFTVEYNPPMQADPFAYIPPADMTVVDDRDVMHQRGWTYFRVTGRWGTEPITGKGQVPFTYSASLTKPAWIRLEIGQRFVLSDNGVEALVRDSTGAVRLACAGGSFLKGLSRPWEGFHAIDSIRRDAARSGLRCSANPTGNQKMLIRVRREAETAIEGQPYPQAEYMVDKDHDLLDRARFWTETGSDPVCEMQFNYLQSVDDTGESFDAPAAASGNPVAAQPGGTPLWPLVLINQLGTGQLAASP